MREQILPMQASSEFPTAERCYIIEMSNTENDTSLSIARARVAPGVTTRWHRVVDTVERYVLLSGRGRMEVGDLPPQEVGPGDVVLIPPNCRQRITALGSEDLLFLAICSPRFRPEAYQDIDPEPHESRLAA